MKSNLKVLVMMLALCCACIYCHAQQNHTVSFSYDLNGNRISREILIQRIDNNQGKTEVKQSTATDFFKTTTKTESVLPVPFFVPKSRWRPVYGGNKKHGNRRIGLCMSYQCFRFRLAWKDHKKPLRSLRHFRVSLRHLFSATDSG